MNDTKWDELRRAMYDLGSLAPGYWVKDLSGFLGHWDREWYDHFRNGGYDTIEWVEIRVKDVEQDQAVGAALRRVYGHVGQWVAIDHL